MKNDQSRATLKPRPTLRAPVNWWAAVDWIGSQRPIYIVLMMVILVSLITPLVAALVGS